MKLATFWIEDQLFGVNLLLTREISSLLGITEIPRAPFFILGLMNLRGQVITIIDPSSFLKKNSPKRDEDSRIIIFSSQGELETLRQRSLLSEITMAQDPFAFVIDRIDNVIDVDEDLIKPPPQHRSDDQANLIQGVYESGDQYVSILNMNEFVKVLIQ